MILIKKIKSNDYNTQELTEILKTVIDVLDLKTIKQVQDLTGKTSSGIRVSNNFKKIKLFNDKDYVICKDSKI